MQPISIRYGETLAISIDAGDPLAVSADMYVGKPGEMYSATSHAELTDGVGVFVFEPSDTRIPIGTYFYQVNVNNGDGKPEKFPSPEEDCGGCEPDFPEFIVGEALDETEVS